MPPLVGVLCRRSAVKRRAAALATLVHLVRGFVPNGKVADGIALGYGVAVDYLMYGYWKEGQCVKKLRHSIS
jgi:hypothetical protein